MPGKSPQFFAMVLVAAVGVLLVGGVVFQSVSGSSNDDDSTDVAGNDENTPTPELDPTETPTPTATPSPTPTPTPTPEPVLEHCYSPRAEEPASPDTEGEGAEQADGFELRPAPEGSLFQQCQVVAFYGHPGVPGMGTLGVGAVSEMIERLQAEAAAYEAANGDRYVVPAFHIITAVAHPYPGDDGTYLGRMEYDELQEWVDRAEEHDFIIFLDLQMGHSTVEAEVGHYLEFLEHPRVHLALDPEWAMRESGQAPGQSIGNIDATEINTAQEMLQELVDEHNLDNQILMVHQFQVQMIRNKELLEAYPGVDLVIHMDGFGGRESKIGGYRRYVQEDGADHGGFKLFYEWDVDFMPPEAVNSLAPQPDIVTFQ